MIQGQIHIRQRLSLHALSRIHHQNRSVTGRQASGNLIIKVHMSRRINQVKYIFFSILRLIYNTDRLGFDRNSPLPLQLHIIEHLRLPAGEKSCHLNDTIRQGRFSMIDMCYNTKIANLILLYSCHTLISSFHI